ncbi:MAG TPA: phosphopantetheine-binding protein [Gaiellaceae bacterium]|nr:phosphopantetheine-binding protein [Gaiellaceae bacterium]
MTAPTLDDVRSFIVAGVADGLAAKQLDPGALPDSFDLLVEGVIDSFGILELVVQIEERFGAEIDFSEIDPDELTRIGPLSRYVQARLA